MHEAKTHLSRIVARVLKGESFIIGKAGKPVAVLSPFVTPRKRRKPGSLKGKIRISKTFESGSDEMADLFEGKEGS